MGNILRMAALAAAVAAVGWVHPAAAKPEHGHGHHATRHHATIHDGYRHAYRYYRTPGYRYSGSSMMPGWRGWYGGERPPGWSHGWKHGWHGHHMPPGLYRQYYR